MEVAVTPNVTSAVSPGIPKVMEQQQQPKSQARRRGAFVFEDSTPRSEFEEFEVIIEPEGRLMDISSKIEAFRIPLRPPRSSSNGRSPKSATFSLSSSSSSILISAEELANSDPNGTTKLVEMKCFICGASLQLVRTNF
jgi:hypothetical protein